MKPIISAAPNGARRGKKDHPNLPISIPEIAAEAAACYRAGAAVLHLHVRDTKGTHSLDAGLYRAAISAIDKAVPGMLVQITSESAGVFGLAAQIECVQTVVPNAVSVAWREFSPENQPTARAFYHWAAEAQVHVQHILYSPADVARFIAGLHLLPDIPHSVLLVLGTYGGAAATPAELPAYLDALDGAVHDWMVCAFGPQEHGCVNAAIAAGGHARVGFENNLTLLDGSLAVSTAALVSQMDVTPASPQETKIFWNLRSN